MYALVDCNNFYVSCERVFDPSLNHKPIVVLSNNNGCIIARSDEVKALDIPMGAPLHLYERAIRRNNVLIYSSNYTLYGDMSSRVMNSFNYFTPDVEVYSIDEAFLGFHGFDQRTIDSKMLDMKKKIYQWTGIPVSIGVGPTKTLAKLANKIAKKYSSKGVYKVIVSDHLSQILSDFSVEDIWGISKGWGARLKKNGIYTALQLQRANPRHIRKCISLVGERIAYELKGISTLSLEDIKCKKSITVSRSFGKMVEDLPSLRKALANHISRAAEKLRSQKSLCGGLYVFINTNRFRKNDRQYSNVAIVIFEEPTDNTTLMIRKAFEVLEKIYRVRYNYKKIGVTLIDLKISYEESNLFSSEDNTTKKNDKHIIQGSLFNTNPSDKKISEICMQILDNINHKMGPGTLFYGSLGVNKYKKQIIKKNSTTSYNKSRSYTTNWNELVKVS